MQSKTSRLSSRRMASAWTRRQQLWYRGEKLIGLRWTLDEVHCFETEVSQMKSDNPTMQKRKQMAQSLIMKKTTLRVKCKQNLTTLNGENQGRVVAKTKDNCAKMQSRNLEAIKQAHGVSMDEKTTVVAEAKRKEEVLSVEVHRLETEVSQMKSELHNAKEEIQMAQSLHNEKDNLRVKCKQNLTTLRWRESRPCRFSKTKDNCAKCNPRPRGYQAGAWRQHGREDSSCGRGEKEGRSALCRGAPPRDRSEPDEV